uniref:ATP-binding cassette sub-family B member 10, mitochondrial n=2 Tax=Lygus hesperus TaxID=30085 RepID=A0A0K8SJ49_LYGHE
MLLCSGLLGSRGAALRANRWLSARHSRLRSTFPSHSPHRPALKPAHARSPAVSPPPRPLLLLVLRHMTTKAASVESLPSAVKVSLAKKKVSGNELRRIFSLARPESWRLTGAIILLFVSSSISMAVPFALGKVIDLIYTTDADTMNRNINIVCGALLAIFLVGGFCNFGRVYLMNMASQRITRNLRENVFRSIMIQETAFFDYNKTGELVNRLSTDTSVVSGCVTTNISDGLRSFIMIGTGVSMMVYLSPMLALVSLCVVPPVMVIAVFYGRYIKKMTTRTQDALAEATQVADERIGNIRTVKTFSKEETEIQKYRDKMAMVLELASKQSLAMGLFYGMTGFSGNAIALIVLYAGGVMVSDSTLTVGSLASFLLYAAYIGVSISGLSSFYTELNKGLGASTRLWEIMDRTPAIPFSGGLVPPHEAKGEIAFKSVSFAYPNRRDHMVLEDMNLLLAPGTVTAIVGSSGSGKTTLSYLLLGLHRPAGGTIAIDGYRIEDLNLAWLRGAIGTVSQEPVLFSGTIRDNVLYGAPDGVTLGDAEVFDALREANAFKFVTEDLPHGLDTLVGERGIMLSGGQKQRIAIARALIKNPQILLLDEATSALDAESEHLVQEALERIMKGRTVLTIAHRLSTIKNADQIAVLDKGKIAEIGTYDALMASDLGVFRNLIKHQAFQQT